jgi:thioredoxin 1
MNEVRIVCLCAAWCRLCDDYARVLEQVRDELQAAGQPVHLQWIDIEDEAELVGDFDVETFPTLLVLDRADTLRFAGAVTPQPETLKRLLRALVFDAAASGAAGSTQAPAALALAQRLTRR